MSTTLYNADNNTGLIPTIDCWGDSLTAGGTGFSITTHLQNYFPFRLINNYGIGGQKADQIACRQGSYPIRITVSGDAFAGTGAVSITSINVQFSSTAANQNTYRYYGTVGKIICYITRTVVSTVETYTITPVFTTTAAIPPNSLFIPFGGQNSTNHIQVLWWGRNNTPSFSGIDTIIDNAIAYLHRPRRVIVIGVKPANTEIIGNSNYNAIATFNATLAANYPNNFIPCTPPTTAEMAAIGYTPTAQDLTDISNGVFPVGMHQTGDTLHFNIDGYHIIAYRIQAFIKQKGW